MQEKVALECCVESIFINAPSIHSIGSILFFPKLYFKRDIGKIQKKWMTPNFWIEKSDFNIAKINIQPSNFFFGYHCRFQVVRLAKHPKFDLLLQENTEGVLKDL